jgi:SAM-dependent methyltransferase
VNAEELLHRFYPESNIGGFSHVDGNVAFFSQIAAVLRPTDHVLDFGAGRGEGLLDDTVDYRRKLGTLKGRCAYVDGCDIDDAVLANPFLDRAKVIKINERLPYEDNRFDIVVAKWLLEHVDTPEFTAQELLRVTKPGGLIAATTPNKWGYIALGARLVPNGLHVRALESIQPERKAEDVFPTRYRLNTPPALRRAFGKEADVFVARGSSEPSYYFGSPTLFRIVKSLTRHLPQALQPTLYVYIRKR